MAENPFTESRKRGERLGQCERFCAGVDLTPALNAGVTLGDVVEALNLMGAAYGTRSDAIVGPGSVFDYSQDITSLLQKDSSNG